MTHDTHNPMPSDEALFDQLVDGELDESARRELLSSLDERPGGWRRLALAFLEAQSLREIFRSEDPQLVKLRLEKIESASSRRWSGWYAVAASVLVAFGLGILMRGVMSGDRGGLLVQPSESIATVEPAVPVEIREQQPEPAVVAQEDGSTMEVRPWYPTSQPRVIESGKSDQVTLVFQDNQGKSYQVEAPLLDAASIDERLHWQGGSAIPAEILQRLEQAGHRVRMIRRYAPLELQDGRQMIVPVDDVRIDPKERPVY